MSLGKKFLKKILDQEDKLGDPKDLVPSSSSETEDQNEESDFLNAIGNLAKRIKENQQEASPDQALANITPGDYEEVAVTDAVRKKMEELDAIIKSIETRVCVPGPVQFRKKYKINYIAELNPAQLQAVISMNGPVLVIAGAGSGKTRVIVHRVAFMLENGIFPQEILLLTFTRKAASEMLNRVQSLLKEDGVQKIFGGTFHSFSNYVLRKYSNLLGIPSNFTIIDSEDSADTIDLIKSELKMVDKERAFPKKHRLQEIISSARNRNLTIREVILNEFTGLTEYAGAIELISKGYEKYKAICNIFDYDDLMEVLRNFLRDNEMFRRKLQEEYKYIMVDEYQDTNIVQKEIVDLLAASHRNVLVVGDDSQSIYSFRGANYENILRFPQTYPECRIIKIEQNYRSNQRILDFTNDIIRNARIGYKKQLYSEKEHQALPVVKKFYDQQTEAEFVVTKVLEYREKGIALNQIAVLVRAFWHARYIEIELNRRGIPYIAIGGLAFNERKHVKDMICYLRIIQNPYDAVAWHRILKYIPGVGLVTARKIIAKINEDKGLFMDAYEKTKFAEGLRSLMNMLNEASDPAISLARKMEIISKYYSPILEATESDYQIRMLDISVLVEMASSYESAEKFLTDFALDPPSKRFGNKTTPLIDESEDKPLTISTIHSAKGLEWFSVIIPHALDGLIPSVKALKNLEELEEERRLFYVACSRAKEELYITMPSFVSTYNGFLSYPSRFLTEIDRSRYRG